MKPSRAAVRTLGLGAVLSVLSLASASCGTTTESSTASELYGTSEITIEIDYQAGAAPFTGATGRVGLDPWQLSRDNVRRMFQSTGKPVVLPTSLDAMEELRDVTVSTFSSDDILAIAAAHRTASPRPAYYVVFVDGRFRDDTGVRDEVLGVSVGDTGVIALFKPVIAGTDPSPLVAAFVEQTTLLHELGHAVGLVDNGIEPRSAHHDTGHEHHCTNDRCVMYWANEGVSSALALARSVMRTGSTIVFDDACLADLDSAGAAR